MTGPGVGSAGAGSVLPRQSQARAFATALQDELWDRTANGILVRGLAVHLADPRLLTNAAEMVVAKKTERRPGVPGVDGETRKEFCRRKEARLLRLSEELRSGTYRPLPLTIGMVGGRRTAVRCWRDRVVEQEVVLLLEPIFRNRLHDAALGWRPECNQAMAVDRVTRGLPRCDFVVRTDISKCFKGIGHSDVIAALGERIRDGEFFRVIESLLVTGVVNEAPKTTDIHQGTILAPLLANIVLTRIDDAFTQGWGAPRSAKNHGHKDLDTNRNTNRGGTNGHDEDHHQDQRGSRNHAGRRYGHSYGSEASSSACSTTFGVDRTVGPAPLCLLTRYGDDIVVLVRGSRVQADRVLELITTLALSLGLGLSERKTQVSTPEEGFGFLGLDIRLRGGQVVRRVAQPKIEEWAGYLRRRTQKEGPGWRYDRDPVFRAKLHYFGDVGADMGDAMERLREALRQPRLGRH